MYKKVPAIAEEDGRFVRRTRAVAVEGPLSLTLNGRGLMTAMVSPGEIEELVTGFLYTEQIIQGVDDIESMRVEGNTVSVLTKNPFKVSGTRKVLLSGCGGTTAVLDERRIPTVTSALSLPYSAIASAMKVLVESHAHLPVEGVHTVGIAGREGFIHMSADIGRYYAFDKVVGYALRKGIDLSGTSVLSSGIISSEMVRKCSVANIAVIASSEGVTDLAVELAEKMGISVIGFLQGGGMIIFTHPERIEGVGPVADSSSEKA